MSSSFCRTSSAFASDGNSITTRSLTGTLHCYRLKLLLDLLRLGFRLGLDLLPFVFQPRPERGLWRLLALANEFRRHFLDAPDIDHRRLGLAALRISRRPVDDLRLELIIDLQAICTGPLRRRLLDFGRNLRRCRRGQNEWNQQKLDLGEFDDKQVAHTALLLPAPLDQQTTASEKGSVLIDETATTTALRRHGR